MLPVLVVVLVWATPAAAIDPTMRARVEVLGIALTDDQLKQVQDHLLAQIRNSAGKHPQFSSFESLFRVQIPAPGVPLYPVQKSKDLLARVRMRQEANTYKLSYEMTNYNIQDYRPLLLQCNISPPVLEPWSETKKPTGADVLGRALPNIQTAVRIELSERKPCAS